MCYYMAYLIELSTDSFENSIFSGFPLTAALLSDLNNNNTQRDFIYIMLYSYFCSVILCP